MNKNLLLTAGMAALLSAFLTRVMVSAPPAKVQDEVVRTRRLQIVDTNGRTRISMSIDADGTAKLSFLNSARKVPSEIVQTTAGETILRFAGVGRDPSVLLGSGIDVGGPRLVLNGTTWPNQKILLGFKTDDVPRSVSDTWGLFFPSSVGSAEYAGIGAGRIVGTEEFKGFLLPIK